MAEGLIAATKEIKDLRQQLDDFLILCSHKFQTANRTLWTSIPSANLSPLAPLSIPVFDRDRPKWWIRQCEWVFYQHRIAENEKVKMAAANLSGVPYVWFQNWSWGRVELSWPQFVIDLCNRFGERTKTYIINGASKAVNLVVQEADEEEKEAEEGIEEMGDGSPTVGSLSSIPIDAKTYHAINFQKQQMKEQKKLLYQVFEDKEVGAPATYEKLAAKNEDNPVESELMVSSSNQQVKVSILGAVSTEDVKGSKHTAPLVLDCERAEEHIIWVKSGIKKMTTIPAEKYFTVAVNMVDSEPYDSLDVFLVGTDQLLVLILADEEQEARYEKEKRKKPKRIKKERSIKLIEKARIG